MDINESNRKELLRVANALADAARGVALPYFRSDLTAENKDPAAFDPVTIADREAEQAMRAILARERPDDAIIGEEFGSKAGKSDLTWVLDPIDGTRAFISGAPSWGILIGLVTKSGPILGIIDQPFTGERFCGAFGQASLTHSETSHVIRTRRGRSLSQAILFSTYPEVGSPIERQGFEAVSARVRLTRFGLDCYAYALLAMGQIDLVIEADLNSYDVCGPIGVIEAAGGIVTDWQGHPAHEGGRILAAGSPELHAEALALLRQF